MKASAPDRTRSEQPRRHLWAGAAITGAAVMILTLLAAAPTSQAATARGGDAGCNAQPEPFGSTPCEGVRPGAPVITTFERLPGSDVPPPTSPVPTCTLNFMFSAGHERYMGTAGHCAGVVDGETTWKRGKGPRVFDRDGHPIGRFVYAAHNGGTSLPTVDFALIRLEPRVKARPDMCHFGGPTGINDEEVADPALVHYYGNTIAGGYVGMTGVGGRWLLPARTGVTGSSDRDRVFFFGHASLVDSGAPVITDDGRALAVISGGPGTGVTNAPRIGPQMRLAEDRLHLELELVTPRGVSARSYPGAKGLRTPRRV